MSYTKNAVVVAISPKQLQNLSPKNDIMGLAIPKSGSRIMVAVVDGLEKLWSRKSGVKIPLPSWPADAMVIESIHVTMDGFVFVCVVGGFAELSALGKETVEYLVQRMDIEKMSNSTMRYEPVTTFFSAVHPAGKKVCCILYKREGIKLSYMYTMMAIPNLRVVGDSDIIYSYNNEVRTISMAALRRGKFLPTDYVYHTREDINYLGKPHFGSKYVPMTFADGLSVKFDLGLLRSKRFDEGIFPEENLPKMIFPGHVNGVIGKIAHRIDETSPSIYGAIQGNGLVLMPKEAK